LVRVAGRIIGLCMVVPVAFGCAPDKGTMIANDIQSARDPLVRSIEYAGDNDESGPFLVISLHPGATKDQARALVCMVVKPAVERGSPPPGFDFRSRGFGRARARFGPDAMSIRSWPGRPAPAVKLVAWNGHGDAFAPHRIVSRVNFVGHFLPEMGVPRGAL